MIGKILVVDDVETVCDALRNALGAKGFVVTVATSGAEALACFQCQEFDLIITDLNMPEMNGHQLLSHIHDINPDIPVIILTGLGTDENMVKAIQGGAYWFLTKPIRNELLWTLAERAIEGYALVRENRRHREHLEELVAERTLQLRAVNKINEYLAVSVVDFPNGLGVILENMAKVLSFERCIIYVTGEGDIVVPRAGLRGNTMMSPKELAELTPISSVEIIKNHDPARVTIGNNEGVVELDGIPREDPKRSEYLEILDSFIKPMTVAISLGSSFESLPKSDQGMDFSKIIEETNAEDEKRS